MFFRSKSQPETQAAAQGPAAGLVRVAMTVNGKAVSADVEPRTLLVQYLREHLRLTTNEVVARLQADWAADVKAYDRVEREILQMSEMLADGLVAQFPSRFA